MSHELKAISAAIIALVGAVVFTAVMHSAASFAMACVGAVSAGLVLIGLLTWIYQITRK